MNGPIVVLAALFIAAMFTVAFIVGTAELDDLLARWRHDRETRRAMALERRKRDALRGPRAAP